MTPARAQLSRGRVQGLFGAVAARKPRIAVIGDVMLDVYLQGDADRISPEAPIPVVRVRERREALGGAANVGQNVQALGARCELVSLIGQDDAGWRLRRLLADGKIDCYGVMEISDLRRPTTVKTRIVARNQQIVRVDDESDDDVAGEQLECLVARAKSAVLEADALVLQDYNKGVLAPRVIRAAIAAAAARGIPIIIDPKARNFFEYRGCSVLKPNRDELEAAIGARIDPEDSESLCLLPARLRARHLLVTLGDQGMVLVSASGEVERIRTTAREVSDVVGAGDTATAYLATLMAVGASVLEAAVVSNVAAGIQVGRAGAAVVNPFDVLEGFESEGG